MAEIKISSPEDLEAWLKDKPREVSVAIASRIIFRLIPILIGSCENDKDLLSFFRASQLAFTVSCFPEYSGQFDSLSYRMARHFARLKNSNNQILSDICSSNHQVMNSLNSKNKVFFAYATGSLFNANQAIERSKSLYDLGVWDSVDFDINFLTDHLTLQNQYSDIISSLVSQPLMSNNRPYWWVSNLQKMSGYFAEKRDDWPFADDDDNWWVWNKWYGARLNGRPTVNASAAKNKEVDLAIANLTDKEWKKGPAHVNGIIAKLFEEAENIPKVETSIKANQQSSQKLAEHFQTVSLNVDAIIKANAAERENHIAKKPNEPEKFEQWAELDKYFEETGNTLGKIQTELQKADNEGDIVDVAENTVPILIEYRDELINQLRSNKKEVVNLILKTSCFAGSIALLNLVGIPPLVSLSISASLLGAKEVLKALKDHFLNKDK